jgi:hypothetical protein
LRFRGDAFVSHCLATGVCLQNHCLATAVSLQGRSLATAIYAAFTIPAFSRHATLYVSSDVDDICGFFISDKSNIVSKRRVMHLMNDNLINQCILLNINIVPGSCEMLISVLF